MLRVSNNRRARHLARALLRAAISIIAAVAAAAAGGNAVAQTVALTYLTLSDPAARPGALSAGLQGALLGVRDNNVGGRFLGHDFVLREVRVEAGTVGRIFVELIDGGARVFILDLPGALISALASGPRSRQAILFNTGSPDDALRANGCAPTLYHTLPSRAMRADALARFAVGQDATAVAWHAGHQGWGARELHLRFRRLAAAPMPEPAYAAWLAVRTLGVAAVRAGSADPAAMARALREPDFGIDGHVGRRLTFRSWNGQLRQPLFLLTGNGPPLLVPALADDYRERVDELGVGPDEASCAASGDGQ